MLEIIHTTVFANASGGGNPCPVVLESDVVTTEQMQSMTKDFQYESVFISKSHKKDCDFHLRYFVPTHEMEMCVHATIAASTVLIIKNCIQKHDIFYETILGKIKVRWKKQKDQIKIQVWRFLPKKSPLAPSKEEICFALGISKDDLLDYPIESYSTSRYKLMIPIKNRMILDQIVPDFLALQNLCEQYMTTGFYPFTFETDSNHTSFYARQFPKNSGYPEDAATGVAASALGAYIIEHKRIEKVSGFTVIKDS